MRRRICRERKTLIVERIEHTNRINGLLCAQGVFDYDPLRRNRRSRLDELQTGDGRPLPERLKAQIGRELDRLEVLQAQLKAVEAERDALLEPAGDEAPTPAVMLAQLQGSARRSRPSFGPKRCSATSTTEGRSRPTPDWRRRRERADRSTTSRACRRPETRACERR